MAIKRFIVIKDSVITNAFKANLTTRATNANTGLSDSLEVFSIFGQASSSSLEAARTLVEFPVNQIISGRNSGNIPASGNVDFYLKLSNVKHGNTLPRQFTLVVNPLSQSFEEGFGLDLDEYTDVTDGIDGVDWIQAKTGSLWTTPGGDFLTGTSFSQFFDEGTEDLQVNITPLVEQWVDGTIPNNGVIVRLSGSQENANRSFYTKRFSARGSEFFFGRPRIEARWDSSVKDDRGRFFASSSLLDTSDNTNTIYLYNYVFGQPKNIPSVGTGEVFVSFHTDASNGEQISVPVTGGFVSTGIYSASVELDTTASVVYDRWFKGSNVFHTGTIDVKQFSATENNFDSLEYVNSITNLKSSYSNEEIARFRVFSRFKDWCPTIYRVASKKIENEIVEDAYFKIFRITDIMDVIPYDTGSTNGTRLSYDKDGNFFEVDMSMLEPGYSYGIKLLFNINGKFEEQRELFKFRVESAE